LNEKVQVEPKPEAETDARRVCPKCQSTRVHRSHRRNGTEIFRAFLRYFPYRCHACDHRFSVKSPRTEVQVGRTDPRPDLRKRKMRRLLRNALIGAICVVTFLVFLYYLIQPSPE
jgi:hypothetical protein